MLHARPRASLGSGLSGSKIGDRDAELGNRQSKGHRARVREGLVGGCRWTAAWMKGAGWAAIVDGGRYNMEERLSVGHAVGGDAVIISGVESDLLTTDRSHEDHAERAEGDVPIGDGCDSGCAYRGSALSPRSGVLAKKMERTMVAD
eukprot:scaffold93253_cov23-Cyclotella_meneghiniana.AAC.1